MRKFRKAVAAILTAGIVAASWPASPAGAIVGGTVAAKPYPWMVNLSYGPEDVWHLCGASMITDRWAVTAAHCVEDIEVSDPLARVGSNDRTSGGQVRRLSRFVTHPEYEMLPSGEANADIALIKLSAPVHVQPVELARTAPRPGTPSRLLGWGYTCRDETPECSRNPVPLHQLDTRVLSTADCRPDSVNPDKELCVGDLTGASGGCQGDSGGPQLVPGHGDRWTLSGVTSRDGGISISCSLGIYTSVPAYLSWIKATVSGAAGPAVGVGD
jgi:secreted trypsin-like serine protease